MYKLGARSLCLLSLVVALACNSEQPTSVGTGTEIARLRIVNAAPGTPALEVTRNGVTTPLAQNLNYGAFTQTCVQLPANIAHTLTFNSGGTSVGTATFTPEVGGRYTAFLTGSGATRRAIILSDATTATTGSNAVRFINVSSGAGDVYVTAPGGELTSAMRVHANLANTATGTDQPAFVQTETTRTLVRLYDVDATSGTPRAELTLSGLPTSRLASVILADLASAGPSASFVTYPC